MYFNAGFLTLIVSYENSATAMVLDEGKVLYQRHFAARNLNSKYDWALGS